MAAGAVLIPAALTTSGRRRTLSEAAGAPPSRPGGAQVAAGPASVALVACAGSVVPGVGERGGLRTLLGATRRGKQKHDEHERGVFRAAHRAPPVRCHERQPDDPTEIDPRERAAEPSLDVALEQLDQAFAATAGPHAARAGATRSPPAAPRDRRARVRADLPRTDAAPDWRALKVAAARATSTRTRRRTSSRELSAARIWASVSAISPARVRPTGAGAAAVWRGRRRRCDRRSRPAPRTPTGSG